MDAVTALARLLSHRESREAFLADRDAWVEQVDPAGRETIRTLDEQELGGQAQLLIDKRRGEVSAFLSRTVEALGAQYGALFQEYAETVWPWPTGHLRHLHDALAFLEYLKPREPRAVSGVDQTLCQAHLRWRQGSRLTVGVCHHRDMGPLSMFSITWSTMRGKLRTVLPLPFPSALGRRLFWRRDERLQADRGPDRRG